MSTKPICACVPFGAPGYVPGKDYVQQNCPKCGRRCWVGPTQQVLIMQEKAELLCMICAIKNGARPEHVKTLNPDADSSLDEAALNAGLDRINVGDPG